MGFKKKKKTIKLLKGKNINSLVFHTEEVFELTKIRKSVVKQFLFMHRTTRDRQMHCENNISKLETKGVVVRFLLKLSAKLNPK